MLQINFDSLVLHSLNSLLSHYRLNFSIIGDYYEVKFNKFNNLQQLFSSMVDVLIFRRGSMHLCRGERGQLPHFSKELTLNQNLNTPWEKRTVPFIDFWKLPTYLGPYLCNTSNAGVGGGGSSVALITMVGVKFFLNLCYEIFKYGLSRTPVESRE